MVSRRRVLNGMLLTGAGLLASSVLELTGPRQALAQAAGLIYGAHPDVSPLVLSGRDWTSKYKLSLKYEWFPSAGPADKALVAGDIDLDAPGGGRAVSLQAATKPGDFPMFMGWAYGDYAATLVRPDSPYKTMADLKGKKIGTVVGSGSYMAWLIWLDSQGMSVNDFQIVNMQGGEVAGALASGVIDGATIWEPYPAMMEHRKIGKIIALYAKVVYDAVVIQTRREVIEKKRDALVSFAAAAMDVQDWIKANPVDAAKLVAKGMVDRGAGETPWEAFDAMIRRLIFAPDLAPVMPSLNKIADTSVKLGVIRIDRSWSLTQISWPMPGSSAARRDVGKPERTDYSVTLERLAPYLTFGILIASWEAASRGGLVSSLILPPPSLILETCLLGLVGKAGIAYHIGVHALHSLALLAAGFVAGAVLGVTGGIVLGLNATLYRAVNPILSFVLPIPAIAWAPVAMIWIGVGWPAVFAIVTYACVAEIIFNVTTGIRAVPRQYVRQVQTFGAHRAFIIWRVILPSAFPYIFVGLKLGLAASWRSLIGAEMFAGVASGLGLMLYQAQDFYATDVVFSALLIIAVVSLAIEQIGMRAIEKRTVGRWGLARTLEV